MEDEQLGHTCKALRCHLCHFGQYVGVPEAPDPRIRAIPDSEPLDEGGGDIFGQGELQVADRARLAVTWRGFRLE